VVRLKPVPKGSATYGPEKRSAEGLSLAVAGSTLSTLNRTVATATFSVALCTIFHGTRKSGAGLPDVMETVGSAVSAGGVKVMSSLIVVALLASAE
jgi:hypothetical protein